MLRDEMGRGWVLVGQGSSDGRGVKERVVTKGCVVGVRMGWDVDLSSRDSDKKGVEGEDDGGGNCRDVVWKVAVLWNVLDA